MHLPAACPWPHRVPCEAEKRGAMNNTMLPDGAATEWETWNSANKAMADEFFRTLKGGGRRFVNSTGAGGRRDIGLVMQEIFD